MNTLTYSLHLYVIRSGLKYKKILNRINLKSEDRPCIINRIFKIKLDEMINDLRLDKIFGKLKACNIKLQFSDIIIFIYVSLLLYHLRAFEDCLITIVLFLHRESKIKSVEDIDRVIYLEIQDLVSQPLLYDAWGFWHDEPKKCLYEGKCTKYYTKEFKNTTIVDDDCYALYRRRDYGKIVDKNGDKLDNIYTLLLKHGAHIKVEWCDQARCKKYLFKYINKGQTEQLFVSPCEAISRIFGFDTHYRNENSGLFDDEDPINFIDNFGNITTMFLKWMDCNKKNEEPINYYYYEFHKEFVWNRSHGKANRWEEDNG
ncbi:LOW QUALITY PROTEIN: hypothetical protein V2J09_006270 [Rumex salicifolius]